MYEIDLIKENDLKWDKLLILFPNPSFYQTRQYGNFFNKIGWKSIKLVFLKNKIPIMLSQIFYKKKLGIFIFYIPGGPLGNIKESESLLINYLKKKYKYFYIKFNSNDKFYNTEFKLFKKPFLIRTSEKRMELKIKNNFDDMYYKFSKNWRHNFNRSERKNNKITINEKFNLHEIYDIYKKMTSIKKISTDYNFSKIKHLMNECKDNIICFECRNNKKKLISVRLVGFYDVYAFDLISATNLEGRKVYASYYIFKKLLMELSNRHIKIFDLSGVDTINNKGVYNFKKGLGSKLISCLGEFEYSNIPFLKFFISIYLYIK